MTGFFVAGTDTGVGKTFVAAALCRALRLRGLPVAGLKPYETGCRPSPLEPNDAAALEREAQSGLPLELRCPFRYAPPLAPAAAAELSGRWGSVRRAAAIAREAATGRVAVVESAGGVLVPLDWHRSRRHTNLDLAEALGLPVILVGRDALGTLNHVALTARVLREHKLTIAALVLSRGHLPKDPSQASNLIWAKRLSGVRHAVVLPRTRTAQAAALLDALLNLGSGARPMSAARQPGH